MKILAIGILPLAAVLVLLASSQPGRAQEVYATSPDHPSTWVDGATRIRQSLHWNADKRQLEAFVTYSTADYADNNEHPPQEDDFILALPAVHFDEASGRFTADGRTLATLRHGLFGDHVALAPGVELSIHRHHGVIRCALISGNSDD